MRLKLPGADRPKGSEVLCAGAHELSFNCTAPLWASRPQLKRDPLGRCTSFLRYSELPSCWRARFGSTRSNRRLLERRFAGRDSLPDDQFGRQLFANSQAPVATKLRELLADELGVDLDRLRPEDELVHHLRMEEFDSLAVAEFIMATEKAFDVSLQERDLVKIRTFSELVELVDREVKADERTA